MEVDLGRAPTTAEPPGSIAGDISPDGLVPVTSSDGADAGKRDPEPRNRHAPYRRISGAQSGPPRVGYSPSRPLHPAPFRRAPNIRELRLQIPWPANTKSRLQRSNHARSGQTVFCPVTYFELSKVLVATRINADPYLYSPNYARFTIDGTDIALRRTHSVREVHRPGPGRIRIRYASPRHRHRRRRRGGRTEVSGSTSVRSCSKPPPLNSLPSAPFS